MGIIINQDARTVLVLPCISNGKSLTRQAILLGSLLALAGCSSLRQEIVGEDPARLPEGPDYVRWVPRNYQAEPLPSTPEAAGQSAPNLKPIPPEPERLPRPKQNWWTEFDNSELNELIDTALANNYDLRAAVARIEQAEKQALISDGARSPTIDFFSGLEYKGPAEGLGTARNRNDWSTRRNYQFGLRTNYEIDLWGRLGYEAQSALELARASAFNREVVALTLIAETTTSYFQYLSLSERITVAQKSLRLAKNVAAAIERRVERGDASRIDLQQQQIAITLIENNLANLQLQRERVLTRLAVFLGKPPSMVKLTGNSLQSIQLPRVQPGLPSELLCRRPDIRRAEAQLASASADVAAARASLLPSISLTGQFGQGSFNLSQLLAPESMLFSLGGNLVANVFDSERKENRVAQTRAKNRELLEQYANTVLAALREVEDSLTGIRLTGLQQQALAEALLRNSRLLEMSQKTYTLGALDLISFLDVQRNVYLAEDTEATARFEQARAAIDLFKSLGGGVAQQDADPCTLAGQAIAGKQPASPNQDHPATQNPAPSEKVEPSAQSTTSTESMDLQLAKRISRPIAKSADETELDPVRPAARVAISAAAQEAEAQAEKEAVETARRARQLNL